MDELKFCKSCGMILDKGKICKRCTKFIPKNSKIPLNDYSGKPQKKTTQNTSNASSNHKSHKRTVAIYSESRGLELGWDLDTDEKASQRAVFCIKCRKPRGQYDGIWVIPGGKSRSLDPEVKPRRVFLCGFCWSPYKDKKRVSTEEIGLPEDKLFNPL